MALFLVLGLGVLAAACGGGGSTTTTKTTPSTTNPSSSGQGSGGTGGGGGGGGGTTTTKKATTPTTPAVPKPNFTSASISPGLVVCSMLGETKYLDLSWSATNATSVSNSIGGTGFKPMQSGVQYVYHCGRDPNSITLTAHGPGGDAATTVSFNYTIPPK